LQRSDTGACELSAALRATLPAADFAVADARPTFTPHVTLVRKMVALDA